MPARRPRPRVAVAVALVAVAGLGACGRAPSHLPAPSTPGGTSAAASGTPAGPSGAAAPTDTRGQAPAHVLVGVFENKASSQVAGSTQAPWINQVMASA